MLFPAYSALNAGQTASDIYFISALMIDIIYFDLCGDMHGLIILLHQKPINHVL
jgi:hypothetical protein